MYSVPTAQEIVDLAYETGERGPFRQAMLAALMRTIGADVALFAHPEALLERSDLVGIPVKTADRSREIFIDLGRRNELAITALRAQGLTVDTDLYSPSAWERLPYVELIHRPMGIRSSLCFAVPTARTSPTIVCLSRTGSRFRLADASPIRGILKALAIADNAVAYSTREDDALANLSRRQKEIGKYVAMGCSNREIAALCRITHHTVRNHLAAMFRELHISTRAELAVLFFRALRVGV